MIHTLLHCATLNPCKNFEKFVEAYRAKQFERVLALELPLPKQAVIGARTYEKAVPATCADRIPEFSGPLGAMAVNAWHCQARAAVRV